MRTKRHPGMAVGDLKDEEEQRAKPGKRMQQRMPKRQRELDALLVPVTFLITISLKLLAVFYASCYFIFRTVSSSY